MGLNTGEKRCSVKWETQNMGAFKDIELTKGNHSKILI